MSTNIPNLLHFLDSVPPPVTLLLVELAPTIQLLRRGAEILSWNSHWSESWLVLAAWWGLCLTTYTLIKYLLPLILLLPALWKFLPKSSRSTQPTTEQTLVNALSDLTIFRSLLPSIPQVPSSLHHLNIVLRLSAILYFPYVILMYLVSFPVILGLAGTFVISYRSPWARTIRTVLKRSAYVRWAFRLSWSFLIGVSASSISTPQKALLSPTSAPSHAVSSPVRFVFTILECQRWWVGLDWTAALLPGERPSWCSVTHQPFSPPSAFNLPPPSSSFFPLPNGKRLKRTATWRWENHEWGILINHDGTGITRVERQPPGIVIEEDKDTGSRLKRAATMIRERTASVSGTNDKDKENDEGIAATGTTPDVENTATDSDGWVYGDNKWDATSSKGGLGKYTRYRRWTRTAILEETVEETFPGPLGTVREQMRDTQSIPKDVQTVPKDATIWEVTNQSLRHQHELNGNESSSKSPLCLPTSPTTSPLKNKDLARDSNSTDGSGGGRGLQNRLKSAVKNAR